jgi:hypothetical protein
MSYEFITARLTPEKSSAVRKEVKRAATVKEYLTVRFSKNLSFISRLSWLEIFSVVSLIDRF